MGGKKEGQTKWVVSSLVAVRLSQRIVSSLSWVVEPRAELAGVSEAAAVPHQGKASRTQLSAEKSVSSTLLALGRSSQLAFRAHLSDGRWSSTALDAAALFRISVSVIIPTASQNLGTLFVLRNMEISSEFKDEEMEP